MPNRLKRGGVYLELVRLSELRVDGLGMRA